MDLDDWATAETLASWVEDVTEGLLSRVGDFSDDDPRWVGPYLPIVNPPIWEIAHAVWFAEWFVLRQLHGRDPLVEGADARYDSAAVPHITRWHLDYPSAQFTRDYVRRVGDGLLDVLGNDRGLDSTNYFVAYAITHYDAHIEALTYTRQTLDWGPAPWPSTSTPAQVWEVGDREVRGGKSVVLGGSRNQPFVMDNERWAHAVDVAPFVMSAAPVTVAEFVEFVDDGGYSTRSLWSPDGADWLDSAQIDKPAYWRWTDGGWEHRVIDRWIPVEETADLPMVHVSWWEAEAFCEWAGRRLPTEAEWELAATTGPDGTRRPWFPWGDRNPEPGEAALDARTVGPVPVSAHGDGDGPWGHRQLIGNAWEWTSSVFGPYPHFEPDAYRDNSEPWFGTRKVLRGGSWATRGRYVRSTFRNFFTPDRRDVLAGFRTCRRD